MKKVLFLFLITALVLPISSFAREGAIPSLKQELKEKKEEIKNEVKENRQENRFEVRNTKAQATMKRLRQGIISRFENTLKHKANIEARIAKIEATNTASPTPAKIRNMAAAKAKLATFSTSKYTADLALFDAKVAEILASSTPLKLTPGLKIIAKTLHEDIKTMRQTLADTLRLIIKAR
jgi:hypothetical protein